MSNTTACDQNIITECRSSGEWISVLEDSIKQNRLCISVFFATWSASSEGVLDKVMQACKAHPEVIFCKVDMDVVEDIAKRMVVRAMPTLLISRNGKEIDRLKGAVTLDDVERKISLHSQS